MTIREQLDLLGHALQEEMASVKGRAYPAGDVSSVLDELRRTPGAPSCGIMFWNEDPVSDNPDLGKVIREFHLVVSRGKGMMLISGESITKGSGGGPPMADLVEMAREAALGVRVEDEQGEMQVPVYRGTGPFLVEGLLLDAFEIRVGLYAQIPRQDGSDGNDLGDAE